MKSSLISKELKIHFRKYEISLNNTLPKKGSIDKPSNKQDYSLTSSLIHDLATPLSSARAAFMVLEKYPAFQTDNKILSACKTSVESAVDIIDNMRSFQNRKVKKLQFSILESITKVSTITNNQSIRKDITVNIQCEDSLSYFGYKNIFERILLNLVNNAIEELDESKKESKCICIKAFNSKQKVVISIRDNGRGIEHTKIKEMLSFGYTSKKLHTGQGLYFVKEMVEKKFKGKILIDSKQTQYTEVFLIL